MKLVLAYIKSHKLSEVSLALHHVDGLTGMSVSEVRGWGRGKVRAQKGDHTEQVGDFEPHTKVEVVCTDEIVDEVLQAVRQTAHTGLPGDGKIYVLPVEQAVRISSGDRGNTAA